MSIGTWAKKDPAEVDTRALDFRLLLEAGETLTGTPTATVTVIAGVDANPSALVTAVAIVGTEVRARVAGGVGATYKIKLTTTTSTGRTLVSCAAMAVEAC